LEKDLPNDPGDRRSDKRPSPPSARRRRTGGGPRLKGPRRLKSAEALSSWHSPKGEGKIDLSRELASAGGTRVGGRDGRDVHRGRDSDDSGGWPPGAAGGGISRGNGHYNNAGRGHSGGRDRRPHRREESGKPAGEKPWNKGRAPVSGGRTGQPAPIMAGLLSFSLEVLDRGHQ